MITSKSITLEKFLSWNEKVTFFFTPGILLVLGDNQDDNSTTSNGAGKTGLFQALAWIAYKKISRDNDVSYNSKGGTEAGWKFQKENDEYEIIRYYKHPTYANGVRLFHNQTEISAHTEKGTQGLIDKILGISYEHFVSTVVILEGMPVSLPLMGPTPRKEYFELALGLDKMWEELSQKVQKLKGITEVTLGGFEHQYTEKHIKMVELSGKSQSTQMAVSVRETRISELNQQITAILGQLNDFETQLSGYTQDLMTLGDKSFAQTQYTDLNNAYQRLNSNLSQYQRLLNEKVCPVCNEPYNELRIKEAEGSIAKIGGEIKELAKQMESAKGLLDQINGIIQKTNDISRQIDILRAQYQGFKIERHNLQILDNGDLVQAELDSLTKEVNSLLLDRDFYRDKITRIKRMGDLLLPSSPFRSSVLAKYIKVYNDTLAGICDIIYPEVLVRYELDAKYKGLDLFIFNKSKNADESYLALSRGRRKRVEVISQLAFYKFIEDQSGSSFNIVVFDEIFDGLDQMGIEAVVNAIMEMWEDKCIYVITHNAQLKTMIPNHMTVTLSGGESSITGGPDGCQSDSQA